MKTCSRCGKPLKDGEQCDCLARDIRNKINYEMKYTTHENKNETPTSPKKNDEK